MEGFLLVTVIFFVWYFHSRLNKVSNDLKSIRRELSYLKGEGVVTPPASSVVSEASVLDEHNSYVAVPTLVTPEVIQAPTSVPPSAPYTAMDAGEDAVYSGAVENEKASRNFEFNIGAKLPVWIGAIALVFAAFYLVKYSIEAGWLQPAVRLTLGGIFGAGLLVAGQWLLDRQHIANAQRMAQGLVGAGLVSLYVCLYAAINLYDLLPPTIGFGCMVVVTAIAVIMSLRHGQAIAAFGLFGGLITPALVSSDEPNALVLFTYLFLLFTGVLYMFSRKGWWGLASVALVGMFAWSALWFTTEFADEDALVLVLFAMGLCGIVLAFTGRRIIQIGDDVPASENTSLHALNSLSVAGGVATIIWLSFIIELSLFDWSMLGLLTVAGYSLAFFMPKVYQPVVYAKLAADLILFTMWPADNIASFYVAVAVGLVVVYTAIPLLVMKHVRDPRFWAGLQLISSLAVYIISAERLEVMSGYAEPFDGFWGVTALIAASYSVYLAQLIRLHYVADDKIRDHLLAIYALAATSFISLGLIAEVPYGHLALAFSVQALVTMWIFSRTNIPFLRHIITGLAFVFLTMQFQQIVLLFGIVVTGFVGESLRDSRDIILADPLIQLGIPAVLWSGVLYMYAQMPDRRSKLTHLLIGTVGFLIFMTVYYQVKRWWHPQANYMEVVSGFMERGLFTFLFAATGAGLFLWSQKNPTVSYLRKWGVFLFNLAMVRIVYFDLMLCNPYFDGKQFVGDWPILNGITLVYGMGLIMSVWAIRTPDLYKGSASVAKIHKIVGFCLLFALVSLTIRQLFHGGNIKEGEMGNVEFYAYSIAWLVTGLLLLGYGIIRDSKIARMASLVFMLLTIGKVFFFDAGELQGLYRVFSFLGLGFSLMALSYFYSRYFLKKSS